MTPRVLLAATIAVAAVALGLGLGLVPAGRTRLIGPLRTFALAAALTVVFTHLLPEAFAELGAPAVLVFGIALVLPAWSHWRQALRKDPAAHAHPHAGLTAGYLGLLVHHVGDGLGLAAYATQAGGAERHADVLIALAVHTVPLVAVVTFAFRAIGGIGLALSRSAGLAIASVAGVLLSATVPEEATHALSAWIGAAVAGLLVHVVTHDLERDLPSDLGSRSVDLLAAALGVVVCTMSGGHPEGDHGHEGGEAWDSLGAELVLGGMQIAPWLFGAYVLRAALVRLRYPGAQRWLATLPQPAFGLDAVLVAVAVAGFRVAGLLAIGILLVARLVIPRHTAPEVPPAAPALTTPAFLHALPWTVTALALAALCTTTLAPGALSVVSRPAGLLLAPLFALPAQLPPVAATVLAAALWERGLLPDVALTFALLAMAPGAAELADIAVRFGKGAMVARALTSVLVAIGVGSVAARTELLAVPLPASIGVASGVLLLGAIVAAAWHSGVRGFFSDVFHSHDSVPDPHAGHEHHAATPPSSARRTAAP